MCIAIKYLLLYMKNSENSYNINIIVGILYFFLAIFIFFIWNPF